MRKLFLFTNTKGNGRTGWEVCYSMADDGVVLGEHVCSNICFMMNDLVLRKGSKEDVEKHFGCQIQHIDICVLSAGEIPPEEVLKKNTTLRIAAEKLMEVKA